MRITDCDADWLKLAQKRAAALGKVREVVAAALPDALGDRIDVAPEKGTLLVFCQQEIAFQVQFQVQSILDAVQAAGFRFSRARIKAHPAIAQLKLESAPVRAKPRSKPSPASVKHLRNTASDESLDEGLRRRFARLADRMEKLGR